MLLAPLGLPFINEEFEIDAVSPEHLDRLLAEGWRHFGKTFFRYSVAIDHGVRIVTPLRIALEDFAPSKSQRRTLRVNDRLTCSIEPIKITPEIDHLFERHRVRFKTGRAERIDDFLPRRRDASPTECFQLCVRDPASQLVAASFFDVGEACLSSTYAIFDPAAPWRSLGIFTMLKEIELAVSHAKRFYYHGYAYSQPSFYDYKKRFAGTQFFDWQGSWLPLDGNGAC